jgi:hypothetical protein
VQKRALLGEDIIDMTVSSAVPLTFNLGDSITVFGSTYILNKPPKWNESGDHIFTYDIIWEGRQYDLLKAQYFAMGEDGLSISPDWTLMGNLSTFIDVLINNLNDHFGIGKWVKGECPDTAVQLLTFSQENCLAALQYLCKEEIFNKEFEITEASGVCTITIKDAVGSNLPGTFMYGRGKGLYNLSCQAIDDKNIVTKLFAFGSDKNLPSSYRGYNQRLKLPGIEKSYIEDAAAVALYGKIAGTKVFDEIFPHRTGTISVLGANVYEFIDSFMDFDLTAKDSQGNTLYLLNGTSAKVHFNTGNLAGYEFEVLAYDHLTHKFTIKAFVDDRNQAFPDPASAAFQMGLGDEYVLIDILMPQSYVDAAEAELDTTAAAYLAQNKQPRAQYSLTFDKLYFEALYPGSSINVFSIGDYVNVLDDNHGVNKLIRIKSFTRNVVDVYDYNLNLTDIKDVSIIQRLIASTVETEKVIANNRLRDVARAARNWKSVSELQSMVFDTDGYFDGTRINPETIETLMVIVGVKSQALTLDCMIVANYQKNPNLVAVTAGTLSHFGIEAEPRDWVFTPTIITLAVSSGYYIYAKCAKASAAASIHISQAQIKFDEDPNYYHFLIGNLLSIVNGVRFIKITYGYTVIHGREITAGKIASLDGLTYFDLDSGEIGGKIVFGAGSSGYSNLTDRPDLSVYAVQSYVDGIKNSLQAQIDGQVLSWFKEYDPTAVNLPASDWTTTALKQQHANDTFTNTLTGASWRWQLVGSVWGWGIIADTATQQALAAAGHAQDTADGKRRTFLTQPTTPYDAGDLWPNGTHIYRCISSRATGPYSINDWTYASTYDRTQSAIDAGLITTGRLEVGSGNLGEANAGVNGASTPSAPNDDVRLWAGATFANAANGTFVVFNDGRMIAKGAVEFGTKPMSDLVLGLMNVAIKGRDIYEAAYAGDGGHLDINRIGHNGTNNYFRDLLIFDGKTTSPMLYLVGSERSLNGNLTKISLSTQHYIVTGASDITCPASEGDMTGMSITMTPKGTKIFVVFSAPFNVSSGSQTLLVFINIAGSNVRKQKVNIYTNQQVLSFQHIALVTPGVEITIKMRWYGTTSIQQRGSSDSERILTAIDLL